MGFFCRPAKRNPLILVFPLPSKLNKLIPLFFSAGDALLPQFAYCTYDVNSEMNCDTYHFRHAINNLKHKSYLDVQNTVIAPHNNYSKCIIKYCNLL